MAAVTAMKSCRSTRRSWIEAAMKGPRPATETHDREHLDEQERGRGLPLAEAEGRPHDEGEDGVDQPVGAHDRRRRSVKTRIATPPRTTKSRAASATRAGGHRRRRPRAQREQQRAGQEDAHRIAQPPDPPQGRERAPGMDAGRAQRHHADRGADRRGQRGAEAEQGEDVAEALERAVEARPAQEPDRGQRLQRVAGGDAEGGDQRLADGEVGGQRAEPDAGRGHAAEERGARPGRCRSAARRR